MNIWKHFKEQPFIVLVALAALPHTAWAIGTYSQGVQPSVTDWPSLVTALAWLVPPLAFAIAMDIGQVVTAGEIRAGNRSKWLIATFYSLAIFTYICQLLHGMHHYPKLEIGSGAAPIVVAIGSIISQCAVFVLPMLLPAATVLYAMAYHQVEQAKDTGLLKCYSCGKTEDVHQLTPTSDPVCSKCWSKLYHELEDTKKPCSEKIWGAVIDEPPYGETLLYKPHDDFLEVNQSANGHNHVKNAVTE